MLSLGCLALDEVVNGGIPLKGITQIVGQSGIGKTQLCLQLALSVQNSKERGGLESACVYVYTNGPFPVVRISEMSESFVKRYKLDYNPMDNIIVEKLIKSEHLEYFLDKKLPWILKNKKIGLIIIDSVAGLYRTHYDNYPERKKLLERLANSLNSFQNQTQMAIVVTNEVSSCLQKNGDLVPCLGNQWKFHVRNNIWMTRTPTERLLSSNLNNSVMPFRIESKGVTYQLAENVLIDSHLLFITDE